MKEQRTGARRVSSRLESSQVLYERGNYRGRRGETGGGRRRETGGEEGGKRESGRRERERETYHCLNEERERGKMEREVITQVGGKESDGETEEKHWMNG